MLLLLALWLLLAPPPALTVCRVQDGYRVTISTSEAAGATVYTVPMGENGVAYLPLLLPSGSTYRRSLAADFRGMVVVGGGGQVVTAVVGAWLKNCAA